MENSKSFFFFISLVLILCSCKFHKRFHTNVLNRLEIAQIRALNTSDTFPIETDSAIVFTASQDSQYIILSPETENFLPEKLKKHFDKIPAKKSHLKASAKEKKLKSDTLITSKTWNIIVSIIVFLAGIIAFLTIPYTGLAIILMALGIILFILAMEKFPAPEEPQYQNPDSIDEPKKPMNRYAKFALAFFLLSILLLLTIFLELTLFVLAPLSFLGAVIFAISALIDIKQKNDKEQGKSLAWTMLILSALPVLLVLTLFVLVLIYGLGE